MSTQTKISIIRSNRKTLSIQLKSGEIIARAPLRMKDNEIYNFIDSKKLWIEKNLDKIEEREKVIGDAEPFTQEELEAMPEKAKQKLDVNPSLYFKPYGTTLIVVVKHSKFWIALHIGDGKCVTYKKGGEPEQPIPWDERCFLNVTTSMSDEDALKRFRHYYSENQPDAIYIATDGVDDSYASDERLHNFYIKLTNSFIDTGAEQTVKELEAFLPILSEEGSGDDISIAGIVSL